MSSLSCFFIYRWLLHCRYEGKLRFWRNPQHCDCPNLCKWLSTIFIGNSHVHNVYCARLLVSELGLLLDSASDCERLCTDARCKKSMQDFWSGVVIIHGEVLRSKGGLMVSFCPGQSYWLWRTSDTLIGVNMNCGIHSVIKPNSQCNTDQLLWMWYQ